MIPLVDLKLNVIEKVNDLFHSSLGKKEFQVLSFSFDSLNLKGLLPYFKKEIRPVAHWQNRERTREYLGVSQQFCIKSLENLATVQKMVEENSDLLFFGGVHFDPTSPIASEWKEFGPCYFFLPQVLFINCESKTQLKVYISPEVLQKENQTARDQFIFDLNNIFNWKTLSNDPLSAHPIGAVQEIPSEEKWLQMVSGGLDNITNKSFEKVVLARKKVISTKNSNGPISSPEILYQELGQNKGHSFSYFFKTGPQMAFMSVTPERLFLLQKNNIFIDSLAGTRPRGKTETLDKYWEDQLLASEKEIHEHRIVSSSLKEKLNEICQEVQIILEEGVMKLPFVQHLQTQFKGELNETLSFPKLITHFHPTPAVGGRPWNKAKNYLKEAEPFDRGLYSAPFGIVSKEYTEFAVGIRSALFENESLHLFGGAGIVEGSKAMEEWVETDNKMKNFESLFFKEEEDSE